jgi:lysosomal acid lipase/cholesteryl ester hydrolase
MQKFDFRNPKKNIEHYGQAKPPLYDLKRITGTKIHLYSSKADYLADANDVEHFLVPNLNPDVLEEHVVFDSYSHLDFVWSTDIAKDVYVPIIKKIKSL